MDRFEAYLLLKRLLRDPAQRRRARLVAGAMELLAARRGEPVEAWGVVGLLAHLDVALTAQNPEARGRVARELAEVEGLDAELGATLERWSAPSAEPTAVEHALWLCDRLVDHAELADPAAELELLRQQGDALGDRLDAALAALGLAADEAGALLQQALRTEEQRP